MLFPTGQTRYRQVPFANVDTHVLLQLCGQLSSLFQSIGSPELASCLWEKAPRSKLKHSGRKGLKISQNAPLASKASEDSFSPMDIASCSAAMPKEPSPSPSAIAMPSLGSSSSTLRLRRPTCAAWLGRLCTIISSWAHRRPPSDNLFETAQPVCVYRLCRHCLFSCVAGGPD